MKKIIILLTVCVFGLCIESASAQFVVKPTFFETQDVSNEGVVSGYEAQAGPYSLWNPDTNTFEQIGGTAPGLGGGGSAEFSDDGSLLSGTDTVTTTGTPEWEKLNVGFDYIIRDITFPGGSDVIGYAAGESLTYNGDGIVLRTDDGGNNWTELWTGEDQGIEAMSFPSQWTGYVGGWNQYFAKTNDSGNTWTTQTPIPDAYIYTGIEFKDEWNGVVTAQTNTDMAVYTTNDGGTTWVEGSGLEAIPYKLTYVEGDTYFLVTNAGQIQKSTDNGATWTTVFTTPANDLLVGIAFYDLMNGIATAESDVYRTTDGGVTWTGQQVIEGVIWRDAAWLDADNVVIVGTPEIIAESTDGGATWPINNLGTSTLNEALYDVFFTPNGTGYIVGAHGVMFRRESATTSYTEQSMYNVANGEWTSMGSFGVNVDSGRSSGYDISGDGSTIVGLAYVEKIPAIPGTPAHATAWTAATGLIDLGSLHASTNRSTRANAVNGDGSVIVGWQDFNGPWKSAVWRKDANGDYLPNEYLLLDPNGDPNDEFNQLGECQAVSADGVWIAGNGDFANNNEPWRWSEATGYESLGTLYPGASGIVTGMSADGSRITGLFIVGPWDPNIPFIWTEATGIVEFNSFVTDTLGYTMDASPIWSANGISANGNYITGWGYDPTIGPWGDLFTYRVELPGVPTNDDCVEATPLNCGDLVTNSTIFATDSGGNGSNDVFYSYTGTGNIETITLNACGPDTDFPTTVRVYSDCTLTNQIAFNDSSCTNQPELEFISDGTTTYIIMIEGYDSTKAGNFQLQLSCNNNAVPNDDCEDAIPFACGDTLTGSTEFATNTNGEASGDVFYSFQGSGTAQNVTVSLCGSGTNFDTFLRVYSDCSGTEIAQNDDYCGDQSQVTFESDGTSTYYVMVEGKGSATGNFSATVSCEDVLGTTIFDEGQVSLYPNPVTDVLQITAKTEINSVTIFNINGQQLLNKDLNSMQGEIDFSAFSTGIYFARVTANNATETFKIVKN